MICQPFSPICLARSVFFQQSQISHQAQCHHDHHLTSSFPQPQFIKPQQTKSSQPTNHLHTNTLYGIDQRISPSTKRRTGTICKTTGIFLYDICRADTFVAIAPPSATDQHHVPAATSEQLPSTIPTKSSFSRSPKAHECISMDTNNIMSSGQSTPQHYSQTDQYTPLSHHDTSSTLGSRSQPRRQDCESQRIHNNDGDSSKTSSRDICPNCARSFDGMHVLTFRMQI